MTAAGQQLPSDIAVRKARPSDARSLGQAMADATEGYRSFAPPGWEPLLAATQAEALQGLLEEDYYWCLVAEQRGALIGQVAFLPAPRAHLPVEDPTLAHLRQLFVRRDHWGTGLATALHAIASEEVTARGYSALRLFVPAGQARARRFYEREGWTLTGGPFEGGFGLPTYEYRRPVRTIGAEGWTDEAVRIAPYDSAWPRRFQGEEALLATVLAEWATGGIHHVGSTAVAGLDAKPVIDILVGVEGLEQARGAFEPLASVGYLYAPYRGHEMHWFCKPHPSRRTHHLHLVPTRSKRFEDEIAFRDRLRSDPRTAAEYAALKHQLATKYAHDRETYTEAKAQFIGTVLAGPAR